MQSAPQASGKYLNEQLIFSASVSAVFYLK